MKINFLLPHYGKRPTGGFKVIYIYANEFARKKMQVNLIYPATCKKGIGALTGWIRTYRDRAKKAEWFQLAEGISKIYVLNLNEKNIPDADYTVATAYETSLYLKQYSSKKGGKIYFIQDLEIWAARRDKILQSWNFNMKKVVISQYLFNIGMQLGIENIYYLPNAINHDKYQIYNDVNSRKDCVVMMYSPAKRKGARYGIEAIKQIKKQKPNLRAILFGKYKRHACLPEWIEYYENPEQDFLVREIYNRAKVFICSSLYEGWGLPAMEAMACGAAVVTTDCGGVRDFAIPNQTAIVCPIKDDKSIVNGTIQLLDNNSLRIQIIENALQKIAEFDWQKNASTFLEIIQNASRCN